MDFQKLYFFLFFFYWVFKKIVWFPKKKSMLQSENKRLLLEDFTGYFRGLVTYCAAFISHNCLVAFFVWILFWGLEICCFGDLSFCWGMFWLLTKYILCERSSLMFVYTTLELILPFSFFLFRGSTSIWRGVSQTLSREALLLDMTHEVRWPATAAVRSMSIDYICKTRN